MANLRQIADELPKTAWKPLIRGAKYPVRTKERARPENVKEQIVKAREFENIRLVSEDVAEFEYRPGQCRKMYRVVVVRKNLSVEKGERRLFDDIRYFFYITNDRLTPAEGIVPVANGRCNQENLIEQLKNGARAMQMPVDNLVSNWAYMVMASLAWTMKAWFALVLPEGGRWAAKHKAQKESLLRMEFRKFLNHLLLVPCQIIKTGRRIVYRLLSWNPWLEVLLRGMDVLHDLPMPAVRPPLRC